MLTLQEKESQEFYSGILRSNSKPQQTPGFWVQMQFSQESNYSALHSTAYVSSYSLHAMQFILSAYVPPELIIYMFFMFILTYAHRMRDRNDLSCLDALYRSFSSES